jgi:hypothetical protein
MSLPTAILRKLHKLIPLLSSDRSGEVIAAADAISRTLKAGGATWHDLANALTEPRVIVIERPAAPRPSPGRATWADLLAMASELDGNPDLSPWETDFVAGVRRTLRRGYPLSTKQRHTLERIWQRVGAEAAA